MTIETYGHFIPEIHDQAINVLEEIANIQESKKEIKKLALIHYLLVWSIKDEL